MFSEERLERAARCLKTLAHPTRLKILAYLCEGEKNVQEINRLIGVSQANLSQHLNRMRDRTLLDSRREGNFVYYFVSDPELCEFLMSIKKVFCKD